MSSDNPAPKSTPKLKASAGNDPEALDPNEDDIYPVIDHWLTRYGSDDAILDVSEMDGFFAALACSPDTVPPSVWLHEIWGGETLSPEWASSEEAMQFSNAVFTLQNAVQIELQDNEYEPLFLESTSPMDNEDDRPPIIVDHWCAGFLRGIDLWKAVPAEDLPEFDQWLHPIRQFVTDEGIAYLETISEEEIAALQDSIEPNVHQLYQHFFKLIKTASTTFMHTETKVGRNDPCPCPCGSGKKYKKCCGLN